MAKVILSGVRRTYEDGTEAVRGVDLTIEDGSFFVLLGPSGCGKTTLLRMIAGLDPVTEGTIEFDGRCINGEEPKKRNTAMVFQNYSLYPDRNVYRNIAFPLESLHRKAEEIDRKVTEVASLLDITNILNRKPRTLSGGQKQRVALARALVREPSVFLLDEPFANLDPSMRKALRSDLLAIHAKAKCTFLYVTHDQAEAMEMGDRIAVMKEGRIEQTGSPMEVFRNPVNTFVAGFLGRPKTEIFPASLLPGEKSILADCGAFRLTFPKERFRDPAVHDGRRAQAGIRPDSFVRTEDPAGFTVILSDLHKMGAKTEAVASFEDRSFHVLLGGEGLTEGPLRLAVREEEALLFDEDGRSLLLPVPVEDVPVRAVPKSFSEDAAEQDDRSGFARFFGTFFSGWWDLLMLNLLFLVSCIGIITIPAAVTAMCRIVIAMEEEEVYFLWKDYWKAFRKDFFRSLLGGVILAALLYAFAQAGRFYGQLSATRGYLLFLGAVMFGMFLLVCITGIWFFPMHAMVDLPVTTLLRNAFVLAVSNLKKTLPAIAAAIVSFILIGVMLWPYSVLYIISYMFSLTALICVWFVYPEIRRRVIIKE